MIRKFSNKTRLRVCPAGRSVDAFQPDEGASDLHGIAVDERGLPLMVSACAGLSSHQGQRHSCGWISQPGRERRGGRGRRAEGGASWMISISFLCSNEASGQTRRLPAGWFRHFGQLRRSTFNATRGLWPTSSPKPSKGVCCPACGVGPSRPSGHPGKNTDLGPNPIRLQST